MIFFYNPPFFTIEVSELFYTWIRYKQPLNLHGINNSVQNPSATLFYAKLYTIITIMLKLQTNLTYR